MILIESLYTLTTGKKIVIQDSLTLVMKELMKIAKEIGNIPEVKYSEDMRATEFRFEGYYCDFSLYLMRDGHMKILIFASRWMDGVAKLKSLLKEIDEEDVLRVHFSSSEAFSELKDGRIFQVMHAHGSARGYKGDKAYVERRVSREVLDNIIIPCLAPSRLPASERIGFFSAEEVL